MSKDLAVKQMLEEMNKTFGEPDDPMPTPTEFELKIINTIFEYGMKYQHKLDSQVSVEYPNDSN